MDKISVIGNFGGGKHLVDGQVIKSQIILKELSDRTDWNIVQVDTNKAKSNPIKFFCKLLQALITTKSVVVMVSVNGRKYLFSLLWFFSTFFNNNIYHVVIGGVLAQEAGNSRIFRMYLNSFRNNYVETKLLAKELKESGVNNVKIMPNFRDVMPLAEEELVTSFAEPYTFCTFSRVTKEKGIEDAVNAIRRVNESNGRTVCRLHIYGSVDSTYKQSFDMIMQEAGPNVCYKGMVAHDRAIHTLRQYYATLFPTFWPSEGNAGTITDSFCAGVPVIATDWRCNSELIRDGYNGVIYPGEHASNLEEAIQWMIDHSRDMPQIRKNCLKSAEFYRADLYMPRFIQLIEKNEAKRKGMGRKN